MFIEILDRLKGERGPLLPKKKPEKELQKIRDANFEKAKPALENPDEVRRMFAKGDFVTKEGYGRGVKGSNIPLSDYEKKYKGITEYYNKTRSGKWSSLTPQQRSSFIKTFEKNILNPKGLLKELRADPKKLEKFKKDVANNSRVEIRRMYGTKGVPLSESILGRIVKEFNIKKFGKLAPRGLDKIKPEVTKDANKLLNILKDNPNISSDELIKKSNLSKGRFSSAAQALQADKIYEGKKRFNIPKNLKTRIDQINVPRGVEEDLAERKVLKPKEIKRSFTDPRKAISKFFDKGTVFEHTFPKTLIPFIKGEKNRKILEITGTRTSPFLNQFKRRFDNLQKGAVTKFLEDGDLKAYNKTIDNIRNTVKKATGGYEIGYIKFDKNKNATPIVNAKPVTEGFKQFGLETNQRMSAFKNAKYSSTLLKNYLKNPNAEIFNSLKIEFPPQSISTNTMKNLDVAAKSYEKAKPSLGNIKKFTNFAQKNIENPLVKALFKTSYGKAALVTGATLSPSLLAADEPGVQEATSILPETVAAGTGAAAVGTKKGRQLIGKGLKATGKVLAPLAIPLEAGFMINEMKKGKSAAEVLASPFLLQTAVQGIQDVSRMTPVERQAKARELIESDESGLSSDFYTPDLQGIESVDLEEVQEKLNTLRELNRQARIASEAPELIDYYGEGLKEGGPADPSKRKFMKFLAGIASIPFIGKYLKLAEPASKVGIMATEGAKLGVDKLMMLINKIKKLGTPDKTRQTQDLQEVTIYKGKDGSEYELVEDLATGDVRVTKDKPGIQLGGDKAYDVIEDRSSFTIKKGRADETTKGKKPPDEYDEMQEVPSRDGTFDDFDDVSDQTIKEIDDELDIKKGFYKGGLTDTIPPERGPMNQGVAQLYQRR